jgi:sugar lactone lactonase YvrE
MLRWPSRFVLLALTLTALAIGQTYLISTYAGGGLDGPPLSNNVASPWGIEVASNGDVYFAASGAGVAPNWGAVYKLAGGAMTLVAGTPGAAGYSGDGGPATRASVAPTGLALDGSGNLYIAAYDRVRKVTAGTGVITTVAGNGQSGYSGDGGPATAARLFQPRAVAVSRSGDLFVADGYNYRIRKVSWDGIITTIAGNGTPGHSGDGGPAMEAAIGHVFGIAVDDVGSLYLTELALGPTGSSNRIRKVSPDGIITTLVESNRLFSSPDQFMPLGIAVDSAGNVYFTDHRKHRILRASRDGALRVFAGSGSQGSAGEGGRQSRRTSTLRSPSRQTATAISTSAKPGARACAGSRPTEP